MALRDKPLRWRVGAVASTSLIMLLSSAAVGAAPAAAAIVSDTHHECVEPAGAHSHAKARPGAAAMHDPNHLTDAQLAQREADFAAALREHAAKRPAGPTVQATITIPVVVHVIRKNTDRSGGNIPDSMINSQINVLNQAFAGATGGAATAFSFQLKKINRVTNSAWYPIIYGSSAERSMKSALREGGKETLNIYTGDLSSGLLGWATFPQRSLSSSDGVVVWPSRCPAAPRAPTTWATPAPTRSATG